ncbi:hypothetical protein CTI12_AA213940 [Artemisia annua]|uniref:Helitron helicase-like domain-containing protein n=1 Tax=Artemisia annua TaxID=35608 RepID=A0A2U1NYI6_ARTAN|nr:hypothetical protein CTI12_AA213940 [Artemisia annua]
MVGVRNPGIAVNMVAESATQFVNSADPNSLSSHVAGSTSGIQLGRDVFASAPAQVIAANGSVSTFAAAHVMSSSVHNVLPSAGYEGPSTTHGGARIEQDSSAVLMDIDFSGSGSADASANSLRVSARTLRRRRARSSYIPAGQRRTNFGTPYGIRGDGVPVQGPIAPPQRQGAPAEYKYFGRSDQSCQHCHAMFWLEERLTGLPVSAAPQQRLREDVVEGLIDFLNDNNALVHLFRTARDKLRDANIPNFQIRLFGVAGSNQYELPTADTIGAIVYEGGPECMTDYDIVIERHSREPESVNKLHPQYMSLQFPLLFIYGEEGTTEEDDYEDVLCTSIV